MFLCQQAHKMDSNYHLVTAEPPFIRKTVEFVHQTKLGREHSMVPSITTHLSFTKSVVTSVTVTKMGVVFH